MGRERSKLLCERTGFGFLVSHQHLDLGCHVLLSLSTSSWSMIDWWEWQVRS